MTAAISMILSSFVGTSFAAKGGVPNDNALSGKACDNTTDRDRKLDGRASAQGHESSSHNDKGVEYR